ATHTLWTEREYVYTPGYIDEFVGEIDANGSLWPILQDANQNAVAMLDDVGAIVRQRILSPYGRVIASEKATGVVPPKSRIGHQGLFADRLNAPTTLDPLDAGAHTIWHNRNRTLLPELGRFAQRDPNATGQGARGRVGYHGSEPHASVEDPAPTDLFRDGTNVYAYAVASPTQHRDPSGLYIGTVMPGPSEFITGTLEGLVNAYAANLEWDVEWATDWSMGDDFHSRTDNSWMYAAMGSGIHGAFDIGIPGTDLSINPLDLMGGFYQKTKRFNLGGRSLRALFSHRIHVPEFNTYVLAFKHPSVSFNILKFPKKHSKLTVRGVGRPGEIGDTRRTQEITAANARFGKDADYKWEAEFGRAHTWHHDMASGRLQLIPTDLHTAAGVRRHIGSVGTNAQ
ncbi:MAG: HNH endonuclease, partial [Phycisphaerales bacterium]